MKKLLSFILSLVLLSLYSIPAFAADNAMGPSLFSSPGSDRSLMYLGQILGSVGSLPIGGGNNVMADLFGVMNGIIFSMAILIAAHTTIISIINTATEGEVMGKKFSAVLVPAKMGFGLLLLLPQPGGYSLAQIAIGWIIVNGIGAANGVWNVILDAKLQGQSINQIDKDAKTGSAEIPYEKDDIGIAKALWKIAVCTQYLNYQPVKANPTPASSGGAQAATPTTTTAQTLGDIATQGNFGLVIPFYSPIVDKNAASNNIVFDYEKKRNINKPVCGIAFTSILTNKGVLPTTSKVSSSEIAEPIENEAYSKLQRIMVKMMTQAEEVVTSQKYAKYSTTLDSAELKSRMLFLIKIQDDLNDISTMVGDLKGFDKDEIERARADGWAHAGSYYFKLAAQGTNKKIIKFTDIIGTDVSDLSTITNGTPEAVAQAASSFEGVGLAPYYEYFPPADTVNWSLSDKYKSSFGSQANTSLKLGSTTSLKQMPQPFKAISEGIQKPAMAFTKYLTTRSDDPIVSMARIGGEMMLAMEIMWIVVMGAIVITQMIGGIQNCVNPLGHAVEALISYVVPLLTAMIALMWGMGATLAIYTPMIPFVVFLVSVFGWIIAVIEAFVGAPLIALGLIIPSEDELGRAAHSMILIVNIFLRPMLMLIGFVAGAKLLIVAVLMINFGFAGTVASQNITGSIFGVFAIIGIYVGLVLTVVNRCFSLIYHVPDKIMRWISGGHEMSGSEGEMSQSIKGYEGKASGAASGIAAGSVKAAAKSDKMKK